MTHMLVFPGQGSQFPGMGREICDAFPAAREVFEEVDDALNEALSRIIFGHDADILTRTENAQPALFAVSMAVFQALQKEAPEKLAGIRYLAGHSLGEYAALAAGGVLGIPAAARLLRARGKAMQGAVPAGVGGMAALLGCGMETAEEICAAARLPNEILEIANDNGGGQIVVSGHMDSIRHALEIAPEKGVKKAVLLPVSAPFHSSLMLPAAEEMRPLLEKSAMQSPNIPVIANVTARPVKESARIAELLVAQITGRVRWRESIEFAADQGITQMHELGAGKVLTGLGRRISPEIRGDFACTPQELEKMITNWD